jgi:N-acetylglucosamine-6-phosphate deacetylase
MARAEQPWVGRHYLSGDPVRLRCAKGQIAAVEPVARPTADAWWLAPALFDVQVNGFGGVDFQTDTLTETDLLRAVGAVRQAGCARFMLTLITDEWRALIARLERLRRLREGVLELQRAIAGWHLEGPFLSTEPDYHGAHDPALMRDPSPALLAELRRAAGDLPLLVTLAPERAGALESIAAARTLGITISLGHTNASAETLAAAVRAGATGFTHLGNACPQSLDRHDNILWRALDTPGLQFSLIPDGRHVAPALFRLLHRAVPNGRLLYTTDAMAAAGAPPGRYSLGRLQLEVGADRVVRRPGRTNFAGSALTPAEGVWRAAEMLGAPWSRVWQRWSEAPAAWLGLPGGLASGAPADFCLVRPREDRAGFDLRVFVAGEEVAQSRVDLPGGEGGQTVRGKQQAQPLRAGTPDGGAGSAPEDQTAQTERRREVGDP